MLKRAFESFYINICIAATFLLACGNTEKEVCASIGNMELAVVLKDGGEIREVQWLITHHNGYSKDGVIDVNDPAAKISGYISNVPADEGYHIALSAITTESGTCGGAADFNIVSKK